MKASQFLALSITEKVKTLYQAGTFIVSIRYYGYKVNLYLLNNYYVEVFVNHKWTRIEKIELMDAGSKRLKFYTDQIKIPANL